MNIDKIKVDLKFAEMILNDKGSNSYEIDGAAYHVQQAVEKSLKYYLSNVYGDKEDTKAFKTHSLGILYARCLEHGMKKDDFPEGLTDLLEDISSWEAGARYGEETVSEREDVEKAHDMAKEMFTKVEELEHKENLTAIDSKEKEERSWTPKGR